MHVWMVWDLRPVSSNAAKLHARVDLAEVAKVLYQCLMALPARRPSFGNRTAPSKTFSTHQTQHHVINAKGQILMM